MDFTLPQLRKGEASEESKMDVKDVFAVAEFSDEKMRKRTKSITC
jgi:hypothetical protein